MKASRYGGRPGKMRTSTNETAGIPRFPAGFTQGSSGHRCDGVAYNGDYPNPTGGNCLDSAILALEDGTVFEGRSFGAPAERSGEVVFNTAITGYQEIFTDPSYTGQIVILTNPQIGNYGTAVSDNEATQASHRRPGGSRILRHHQQLAIGYRSPRLSRAIRYSGRSPISIRAPWCAICAAAASCAACSRRSKKTPASSWKKPARIPSMAGLDLATRVSTPQSYQWTEGVEKCSPSDLPGAGRGAAIPRSRLRFRHQAEYSAPPGAFRLQGYRGALADLRRRRAGAEAGRRVSLERPRRSRTAARPDRQRPQTDRQDADLRHLPRQSDPGPGAGRQNVQTEVRPSRRQSSGASTS